MTHLDASWQSLRTPARTVIGRGSRAVCAEAIARIGGPVLVVHGRSGVWADELADTLRDRGMELRLLLSRGEPALPGLEDAISMARDLRPAVIVAIGGGSPIDLGKAVSALVDAGHPPADYLEVVGSGRALEAAPLPFIAVPTTAGTGAEATKNAVIDIPSHKRKVSLRDDRMIPDLAVLDADLTDGLPWPVTLATGMDAVTQLIEPFLSARANPATDHICRHAIGPAMTALIRLSSGEDAAARQTLLTAAHLSGIALANAGLGAVHGLAGVIGGLSGAPHGAICASLLPDVLEANRAALRAEGGMVDRFDEVDRIISGAFGARTGRAADLLRGFLDKNRLERPEIEAVGPLDVAVQMAASSSSMKANPVALSPDALRGIVLRAFR